MTLLLYNPHIQCVGGFLYVSRALIKKINQVGQNQQLECQLKQAYQGVAGIHATSLNVLCKLKDGNLVLHIRKRKKKIQGNLSSTH